MCHVLVIEDEPLIASLICDFLEEEGATTFDIAVTEREAVRMAAAHQPVVITADVRLIEGTGPAAVEAIRSRQGPVPTIFLTATPDECEPRDHAVAILPKPFTGRPLATAFARAWATSPFG